MKNNAGQVRSGWLILVTFVIMFLAQSIFMTPGLIIFEFIEGAGETNLYTMGKYPWIRSMRME